MTRKSERSPQTHGFGIVVLAMILAVCLIVNMWLRVPVMAQVLGSAAYAVAFVTSLIAACIAALILDDDELVETEDERLSPEPISATVEVLARNRTPR